MKYILALYTCVFICINVTAQTEDTSTLSINRLTVFTNNSFITSSDLDSGVQPKTNSGADIYLTSKYGIGVRAIVGYTNSPFSSNQLYYQIKFDQLGLPNLDSKRLRDSLSIEQEKLYCLAQGDKCNRIQRSIDSLNWLLRDYKVEEIDLSDSLKQLKKKAEQLEDIKNSALTKYLESKSRLDSLQNQVIELKRYTPTLEFKTLEIGRIQFSHAVLTNGPVLLKGLKSKFRISKQVEIEILGGKTELNNSSFKTLETSNVTSADISYHLGKQKLGIGYALFSSSSQKSLHYVTARHSAGGKRVSLFNELVYQLNSKVKAVWKSNLTYNFPSNWDLSGSITLPFGNITNPINSVFSASQSQSKIFSLGLAKKYRKGKFQIEGESRYRSSGHLNMGIHKVRGKLNHKFGKKIRLTANAIFLKSIWRHSTSNFNASTTTSQVLGSISWSLRKNLILINSLDYLGIYGTYTRNIINENINLIWVLNKLQISTRLGIRHQYRHSIVQGEISASQNFGSVLTSMSLLYDPITGRRINASLGYRNKRISLSGQLNYSLVPLILFQTNSQLESSNEGQLLPNYKMSKTNYQLNINFRYTLIGK